MDRPKVKKILILAFLCRLFILFISSSHPDIGNHLDWGQKLWQYGPKNFYEQIFWKVSWPNQPPASILLFALVSKTNDLVFSFFNLINTNIQIFPSFIIPILEKNLHTWLVKFPFLLSDLVIGIYIYKILHLLNQPKKSIIALKFWLFNPIVIYNSTVWGQTDSLINLLVILSIYFFLKKQYFWWISFYLFSLYFKLSLLIYLPIYFVEIIKTILKNPKITFHITSAILFCFLLLVLQNLPFKQGQKNIFEWIIYIYKGKVFDRQGNMLNGNAFNFWTIFFSIDLSLKKDLLIFGLKAEILGYLLTIISIVLVCLTLVKKSDIIYSLFLISFASFIFLTNIHERYLYPIFPLYTILLFTNSLLSSHSKYISITIIHFLNLYNLWFYPMITPLKTFLVSFNFFIPRILSTFLCFFYLTFLVRFIIKNKHD